MLVVNTFQGRYGDERRLIVENKASGQQSGLKQHETKHLLSHDARGSGKQSIRGTLPFELVELDTSEAMGVGRGGVAESLASTLSHTMT